MTVELNLANLIWICIALLSAFTGMVKLLMAQHVRSLDARFEEADKARLADNKLLEKRLDAMDSATRLEANQWQRVERELLSFKADMPLQYVRREDYIRGQSIIEAKLDGLASKLENFNLRQMLDPGLALARGNPNSF
jgi:hypothetical protein